MKRYGLLIGFCTILFALLPAIFAQAPAKDGAKDEKKANPEKDEKKDPEKKDEKKDPEKKDAEPKKVKLVYAYTFTTKIMNTNPESNRNLTVELKEVDPKKVYEEQMWQAQQMQQLQRSLYDISMQRDFKQRMNQMQNYQRSLYNYQMDLAKRKNNIYSTKPMEVRASDDVKVRCMFPPVEFDDLGFQKKWTKKELEERRDKTGLPGFDVDLDALKSGQVVELYMTKNPAPPKAPAKKKKDDDVVPVIERPEFVMIVILQEAAK